MSVPRPADQILSRHDTTKSKPVFPLYVDKIIKINGNYGYFIMFLLCGLLMSKNNFVLFYPAASVFSFFL